MKQEGFSTTALKQIKRMSKDQLVNMVLQLNNYAENQKAQNIILLKIVEDMKIEIQKQVEAQKATESESK